MVPGIAGRKLRPAGYLTGALWCPTRYTSGGRRILAGTPRLLADSGPGMAGQSKVLAWLISSSRTEASWP